MQTLTLTTALSIMSACVGKGMLGRQVEFTTAHALEVAADVIVVEDCGWLSASRGLAATLDSLYPELRAQREQALEEHGGAFGLGDAIVCRLSAAASGLQAVIWAVTYTYQPQVGHGSDRVRATPLDVASATTNALRAAAAMSAQHVVMPAIGTRTDHHVLPPVPKKLPRYVMGAAQLVAINQLLAADNTLQRITLALTQRDYMIFHELLGSKPANTGAEDDGDD